MLQGVKKDRNTYDEEELDEEADEPHHNETDRCPKANLLVLCERRCNFGRYVK